MRAYGAVPTPRVIRQAVFPWRQGMPWGDMIASVKFSQPERLPGQGVGHVIRSTQVMEFVGGTTAAPYQMLLGRDILCRGTFTMSFDGHFTFSL